MTLKYEELKKLIQMKTQGNLSKFAKLIKVDAAQLFRIVKFQKGAGAKFLSALMVFCEEQGIDYKNYIFLP